jgi:3-isopropylmalate dehydrogenase
LGLRVKNRRTLLVMPGEGIGREVTAEATRVVEWFASKRGLAVDIATTPHGSEAYRTHGAVLPPESFARIKAADAILFGATGGPEYDAIPAAARRLGNLLHLRRELGLYANVRPVKAIPALADASTLKPEVIAGVDMVIVRELSAGLYFGEPRGVERLPGGKRRGVNTHEYTSEEIDRVARFAFELARGRTKRVVSIDKANVMEAGQLWREEVQAMRDAHYPDVALTHMLADNAAMQLVRNPRQFDVIVTDNMFGDILSDCAAMVTGSLGMLPSASFSLPDASGRRHALYEPVHGSAPDIAGKGIANPLGAILSVALALRHSFDRPEDADLLETSVTQVVTNGVRTADIAQSGRVPVGTRALGDAVIAALDETAAPKRSRAT